MAEFKAGVANALHPDAAVEMSTRGNEESTRAPTDSMRGGGKSGKLFGIRGARTTSCWPTRRI